jgi:hypothetical protein
MLGPNSTRVEKKYALAEAAVVIGKIAFEFLIHDFHHGRFRRLSCQIRACGHFLGLTSFW